MINIFNILFVGFCVHDQIIYHLKLQTPFDDARTDKSLKVAETSQNRRTNRGNSDLYRGENMILNPLKGSGDESYKNVQ